MRLDPGWRPPVPAPETSLSQLLRLGRPAATADLELIDRQFANMHVAGLQLAEHSLAHHQATDGDRPDSNGPDSERPDGQRAQRKTRHRDRSHRDRTDRRRAIVELSRHGKLALCEVDRALEAVEDEILDQLDTSQRSTLRQLLARLDLGEPDWGLMANEG